MTEQGKKRPEEQPDKQPTVDLSTYNPTNWDECVYIQTPIPERTFTEDEQAKYIAAQTERGVIIVNIVHRDYPNADLQVQLSPQLTPEGVQLHTFFRHVCPSGDHIPDPLAEDLLINHFLTQIMEQFDNKPSPN